LPITLADGFNQNAIDVTPHGAVGRKTFEVRWAATVLGQDHESALARLAGQTRMGTNQQIEVPARSVPHRYFAIVPVFERELVGEFRINHLSRSPIAHAGKGRRLLRLVEL